MNAFGIDNRPDEFGDLPSDDIGDDKKLKRLMKSLRILSLFTMHFKFFK